MKGIILAAGKGTRLYPMTKPVCKPLLPVYDKPLIYYPLSVLIQAGIYEVLIIIPPGETRAFRNLLGDGSQWGMRISYAVQERARGIADAMLVGASFIGSESVCLVLGDNIFYSRSLGSMLKQVARQTVGATVFGCYVDDPRPFGVVEFDASGRAISIEEKPEYPRSNYVVPGLYFYDNQVVEIARSLKPSARGELEITDVNREYLSRGQLQVMPMEQDTVWLDAGTADSLLEAAQTIKQIQEQSNGHRVGCIEELAYWESWITLHQVHLLGQAMSMTPYGQYMMKLTPASMNNQ